MKNPAQLPTLLLTILLLFMLPAAAHAAGISNISDIPLESTINPAPANIMFILDNSGSMDWEFMCSEKNGLEKDGLYQNKFYLYPDSAYINSNDRIYDHGYELNETQKREWLSQWHGYNKLFYNPNVNYAPWPEMPLADTAFPLSNPNNSGAGDSKLNMTGEYFNLPSVCIVVDNKDSGFFINTPEAWEISLSTGSSFYGEDYCITTEFNDSLNDWVKWTPLLPSAGNYKVAVLWQANAGRDSNVSYQIYHNGQTDTSAAFDMKINGGQWNETGEFYFSGDGSEYVLLNPVISGKSTYSADAVKFYKTENLISIKNAHYFMLNDINNNSIKDAGEEVYLVNFIDSDGDNTPDSREYYLFSDEDENGCINTGELIYESLVPDEVKAGIYDEQGIFIRFASDQEDIQNFANWFSYYRKRELAVKAATAEAINTIEDVNIGFYSINPGLRQQVLPVKVQTDENTSDNTDTLLSLLYTMDCEGSSPLRTALKSTGQYYHTHDNSEGGLGNSPYAETGQGGACQQSFAVIMTDGFWNGPEPEIGNQDADTSSPYDGFPYADSYSETLADVAMKYYKEDLAPDLDNMVPTNSCDRAVHQHMVTHCISFGVSGTLNPSDYHSCLLDDRIPQWPDPEIKDAHKTDDLWHASINGRGSFFSASDPQELISSLQAIISPISSKISSGASAEVKGRQLSTESVLYQATYIADEWTGDLSAYPIDSATGEIKQNEEDIIWQASEKLENTPWDARNIISYDPVLNQGIEFCYDSLNDTQKAALNFNADIVDYIKGKEVQGFRTRAAKSNSVLGDIVHSAPVLTGNTVFIGANDGMLHAFNAETGDERFAYVPDIIMDKFHDTSNPEKSFYKNSYEHCFFVDSTPFVRTGVNPDNDGRDSYFTYLISGLGKGGKGLFCLDISTADAITQNSSIDKVCQIIKWEYPLNHSQDNDLGYTYSRPVIVKSNALASDDPGIKKWVVIFGNGYESVNGRSVLYILNMDGSLLRKIDTGEGRCNGLSSPAVVDIDSDMTADYVYAGDLNGNIWKFDLRDSDPANWDIAFKDESGNAAPLFSVPEKAVTTKPAVMFHCSSDIGSDCLQETSTGYMVFFGTGRYIADSDRNSVDAQYVFGTWDYGSEEDDSAYLGQFNENSSPQLSNMDPDIELQEQTVAFSGYHSGKYMRVLSDNELNWSIRCSGSQNFPEPDPESNANAGWYFKLPLTGERIITDLTIRDGRLLFTGFTPNTSPCSGGGNSIIHTIDACTGKRLSTPFWDINNDRKIDANDFIDLGLTDVNGEPILLVPSGIQTAGLLHTPVLVGMPDAPVEIQIYSGSAGNIETVFENEEPAGMIYWRQW